MIRQFRQVLGFGLALGAATALPGAAMAQGSCDRDCLQKFVAAYVDAMVKHDPSSLPLAPGAAATQNGQPLTLGQGVWRTITGVLSQPQFVSDVAAQQVGYVGVISDAGQPAFFGLRLKIVDGKIAQIETLLTHDGEGGPAFEPQGFIYREAPYIRDVPVRETRAELLAVANDYWNIATSTHDGGAVPYSVDCWHFENGMNTDWERAFMPNELSKLSQPAYQPQAYDGRIWTCAREVYLTTASYTAARDREFLVDPDRGLVMVIVKVDVKGRSGPIALPRAGSGTAPAAGPAPAVDPIDGPGLRPLGMSDVGMKNAMGRTYTAYHFEVMRIVGGKITREQDIMHQLPAGAE